MTRDPYLDPDTGVLVNLLGISEPEQLARAETDLSTFALIRLDRQPLPGDYDLNHLCGFHRAIFQDIYEWAGRLRTVGISKRDTFCLPQYIEDYATGMFRQLAREGYLRNLSRDEFLDRLTFYYGEVNALHPFREGNGRTQRAFWNQLACEAGRPIRWERMGRQENLDASIAIMRGDQNPLRKMFDSLVD